MSWSNTTLSAIKQALPGYTLSCSVRNNVPTERCPECQKLLSSRCACCTCQQLSLVLTLASCGTLALCLFPFWNGPKCTFRYITESATNAVVRLTGGLTSLGPPAPGQYCYVFGRQTQVVDENSGGTHSLSSVQLLPVSIQLNGKYIAAQSHLLECSNVNPPECPYVNSTLMLFMSQAKMCQSQ